MRMQFNAHQPPPRKRLLQYPTCVLLPRHNRRQPGGDLHSILLIHPPHGSGHELIQPSGNPILMRVLQQNDMPDSLINQKVDLQGWVVVAQVHTGAESGRRDFKVSGCMVVVVDTRGAARSGLPDIYIFFAGTSLRPCKSHQELKPPPAATPVSTPRPFLIGEAGGEIGGGMPLTMFGTSAGEANSALVTMVLLLWTLGCSFGP
ncbi:hypothetical protein BC936DRAFT_147307 [Jimgerdemannia flammicorona]|uniref:Uncharacterized protein n=1 Tax=Jimgerdemannia flammicorona TaxID=994334 RepID=A0A433D5S2_9FUNG|nr:hypothetical protein BC936DRAFT_147307 [Jimgerdemannia flammicorona]